MESAGMAGKCHISESTLLHLNGEYAVEEGTPNDFLKEHKIKTFFIKTKTQPDYLSTTEKVNPNFKFLYCHKSYVF